MKFRVTLALPGQQTADITLSCDVTTTVGDVARALLRSGVYDGGAGAGHAGIPHAGSPVGGDAASGMRAEPVTLECQTAAGGSPIHLDPMAPLGESGLQSGSRIHPVPEFGGHPTAERLIPVAGTVEVRTGHNGRGRGAVFSLVAGTNTIGRDTGSRIFINDGTVSRRHAVIEVGEQMTLRDAGSRNRIYLDNQIVDAVTITASTTVVLGDATLRITPGPPVEAAPALSHRVLHTRTPRVAPRFVGEAHELPQPPRPATANRIPMLAMLAPMMMGGVMFAVTSSPLSLLMVAFTPMMMIGSWLDGRLSGRRTFRRDIKRFHASIESDREKLRELRLREIAVRAEETPDTADIAHAISERGELLWTRRPEHRAFLEVRLGMGTLASRTTVTTPSRGEVSHDEWEVIQDLAQEFSTVGPVPVLERFDRCGSLAVTGPQLWADGCARSLIVQIAGLHSPTDVTIACFASPEQNQSWGWLKWLPHIDPVASPLPVWQLADSERTSSRLLMAIESLVQRRARARSALAQNRSHLAAETRNDDGAGEAVTTLPTIPVVVVLVVDDGLVDKSRLIALAEDGPDNGIHLVWVSGTASAPPAACRTVVDIDRAKGQARFVRSGSTVELSSVEFVDQMRAMELAQRLAPVEDAAARELDESDLPPSITLSELHGADILGGGRAVEQSWVQSRSLTALWQRGEDREPLSLAAPVGQSTDGPLYLDLRVHGPHALIGGTTGAGKSEFLQSWIMSMAATVSPDRLTFLLVDYKGGAAFAECVDLPHTVGLVTDLSPHLVRRALVSLRAELRYREGVLAERGAKDLATLERRSDPAAPPILVIVIDEFAALASEVPEFVDGMIDIAQRGRSLGLHLIMATQRPAGVIRDNLRANTNLRVALRMADEADSSDVIGTADAAHFDAATPGRGAITIGAGTLSHFQAAYLGGRTSAVSAHVQSIDVRSVGFTEGESWNIRPEAVHHVQSTTARDIERVRDGIVEAAMVRGVAAPRRPWLDELPTVLSLSHAHGYPASADSQHADAPVVGVRDDPSAQAQTACRINFDEVGNVALIGASGTGKTSALVTIAAELSRVAGRYPVDVFGIDAAGGALNAVSVLPTVGAVAPMGDRERVGRVLRHLHNTIALRGARYAAERSGTFASHRADGATDARLVLLLDGITAFRQETELVGGTDSLFTLLSDIMMTGRAVGVHVVVTADRGSAIPASLSGYVQSSYVFRLANPNDYAQLDVSADMLESATAGRAVLAGDSRAVQFAVVGESATSGDQHRALDLLASELRASAVAAATEITNAPELLSLQGVPSTGLTQPVFGINTQTMEPATFPTAGLVVLAGPQGSGLSTAAATLVLALTRFAEAEGSDVDSMLLSYGRGGVLNTLSWGDSAHGDDEVARVLPRLVAALGGRTVPTTAALIGTPIGGGGGGAGLIGVGTETGVLSAPVGPGPLVFPRQGARGIIVVERAVDADGQSVLPNLIALARAARRAQCLVVFEFEQSGGNAPWELFTALKQPRWGLSLQPDASESQSPFREDFGRAKRADFPSGRGFAVSGGRVSPVQVAVDGAPHGSYSTLTG